MTSTDGSRGGDPIDPDFAGLFRPEEISPTEIASDEVPDFEDPDVDARDDEPVVAADDEPHFEQVLDPVLDPRAEDAAHTADEAAQAAADAAPSSAEPVAADVVPLVPADPLADTGRLFRSQGVADHDRAVLALPTERSGRLRTLERRQDSAPAAPAAAVLEDAGPLTVMDDAGHEAPADDAAGTVTGSARRRRGRPRSERSAVASLTSRGITAGAVYLLVIGVTVLVGFANALLSDGDVGWLTGLALVASTVFAALNVRRADDVVAVIVPPIAFLAAAMTAGQLFIGSAEGSVLNRAVIVFFTLADNWVWIIGATVAAALITVVRRRRS